MKTQTKIRTRLEPNYVRELLLFIIIVAFAVSTSEAQWMDVQGGNQVMSITTAVPGSEPTAVINTNTTLRYRRTFATIKITVSTSCPSQSFDLKAVATNVTSGTAAPEVTLTNGMPATDFVTSIPFGFFNYATCSVRYTASATFAQGNSAEMGNDVHTVTYTLIRQ